MKYFKYWLLSALVIGLVSCAGKEAKMQDKPQKEEMASQEMASQEMASQEMATAPTMMMPEGMKLLDTNGSDYFVYEYHDRVYVIGQAETNAKFLKSPHLPYTKTLLGAGPHGETVVFEVDKKNPNLAENLLAMYEKRPKLVYQSGDDYFVFKHHERLFVVGDAEMANSFANHGHLPYTRTMLGAGPEGQTVVFQVDKKDPNLTQRIVKKFKGTPRLVETNNVDMWVYSLNGRIFLVGTETMAESFMEHGHLPYTRTLLGAGPEGETVVIQVDKKNPELAERLEKKYLHSPRLVETNDIDYFVYEYKDRVYVIGQAETANSFEEHGHLPYTRTLLGAGPIGETVVIEVNKKDPSMAERLEKTYLNAPRLVKTDVDYWEFKLKGRIFLVGQAKTAESFQKHGHLPYTRTMLGAGPMGETVVIEVDKKDPTLADWLEDKYVNTPKLLETNGSDFWVYKYHNRIFVLGDSQTQQSFIKHKHLPYTRTVLGAGPMGETVVFEVNKKDPSLADALQAEYLGE